jgi:hypothetical protein
MIVNICCLIIFIIYFAIFSLLSYYFIKKRTIWNSLFSLESICNSIKELIVCPEHFLIWLPFIDFENTVCSEKKKQNDEARVQIRKVLEHIAILLKDVFYIKELGNQRIHKLEKMKWILEGTMKDYDRMCNENALFYNNLANSYDILNDKCKKNEKEKDIKDEKSSNNFKSLVSLEDLVILENNIDICETISNILAIFTDSDYKVLNQIDSGYMSSLLYDLIETIRLYKIECLMQE